MSSLVPLLYLLSLSLWVGGMSIFTFLVTPAIFRSFDRDRAGEIVGSLFPGYFFYTLVLSAVAFALFFLAGADGSRAASRASRFLLFAAVLANTYIVYKLHPDAVRAKRQVASFERDPRDSPARREFRKLHAVSSALNLGVLAVGIALLVLYTKLEMR